MPCVYIIFSKTKNKYYTGSSRENYSFSRLKEHNSGRVRSTKSGRPWTLEYEEYINEYTAARKRENFLKTGIGREWIKEKINPRKGG